MRPNTKHFAATRKTREGGQHEDRDAQFMHIAKSVADHQSLGNPVISVDAKKRQLIGDFKNAGKEWLSMATPKHGYTPGLKVSDQELAAVNIDRDTFQGQWNYRVLPHNSLV